MIFELKNKDTQESLGFFSEEEIFHQALFFESLQIHTEIFRDSTPVTLAKSLGLSEEKLEQFKQVLQDEIDDHE